MPQRHPQHTALGGFTLLELSIVLVIIGLIVGGILVGKDLIKAAELRNTASNFEKLKSAINAFRIKYNGVPGDMPNATDYWPALGVAANGNGNGFIDNWPIESAYPWAMLKEAGLFAGDNPRVIYMNTTYENLMYFYSNDLYSYFGLFSPSQNGNTVTLFHDNNTGPANGPALSPADAYSIDSKIDDGRPYSGHLYGSPGQDSDNVTLFNCSDAASNTWASFISDTKTCRVIFYLDGS
jgi:prepilin-type N-terminal cleavage/methylation domain-containing protein